MRCRARPSLRLDMIGQEHHRQFAHCEAPTIVGARSGRIEPVRDRAHRLAGEVARLVRGQLADRAKGKLAGGGLASCARPVLHDVAFRSGWPHPDAKAGNVAVPRHVFRSRHFEVVHHALGNPSHG